MTELEKKIWNILGRPQTAALATIGEGGAPRVRYVTVRALEDLTLHFCTSHASRKARQIAAHPDVHLTCGNLEPPDDSAYLQVAGRAEIRSDAATKRQYWLEGWSRYFQGPEDPDYVMVFVTPSLIEYNAPGSLEPEIWRK
ncbi:MAG: pyridoxamine 5'-phosphate oxidase family protein [Candidatus Aminicenantes bacterium]|nr:pyridoxamine 5'-phosphate oxidase family protein [Candidatus Aminicenantes bacterium]